MKRSGDLDYAMARIAARFGERPTEATWRALAVIRELPALLDAARQPPFRRWTAGLAPDADAHAIEAALRANGRALAAEVRLWMPARWQPAVDWACTLADLPVAHYLAQGGAPLHWMRDDAAYRDLAHAAVVIPAHPAAVLREWGDEWWRRVPERTAPLRELARLVQAHRGADADRHALVARLALLYRRAPVDPAAAFVFLALSALDMERLRGELLRRLLFARLRIAA